MKTTLIEHLHLPQIKELSFELFEYIEIAYGIKSPDDRFTKHFVNVLNKTYGHLNFEQLEDAFFRNSTGLLDNFLPKFGYRTDSKVLKFNIQDLTKIINAFCKYIGLEKNDISLEKKVFTNDEKKEIHREWLSDLMANFDTYKNDNKKLGFQIPLYTSKFLAKFGLIENEKINLSENKINIKFGKRENRKTSLNEKLIYKCFDDIINKNMHLREFISDTEAMPY